MATIINHDLRCVNGATIFMPPYIGGQSGWGNLAIPDVNNDIDTAQQYPMGTILRSDERAWRYATVCDDLDIDGADRNIRRGSAVHSMATINSYTDKLVTETGFNTLAVYKVKVDMTTHVNCFGTATSVAANEYAGGHFTLYTSSSYWGCRVIENTVEDSDGYVELTLESPLPVALTSSHILMFEENMYWSVVYPGTNCNQSATVGFPCIWELYKTIASGTGGVTAGSHIWLQTWGPYEGIIMGNAHGAGETERMQYFCGTGYPDKDYYPNSNLNHPQIGGWHTACNAGTDSDFDYNYLTTFFLMIAP